MLGIVIAASGALAQSQYPAGTVRIIVPSTPGATTDVLARTIGLGLTQSWGQPVIVENRPGADEMIGVHAAAKAPADGYTLLVTSNAAITAAPHLHSRMNYDPQKDLTPILMLGQVTPVMNVPASLPVKSVQEFIALAKAKPGALNYGSFGNGTYAHVAMEEFKLRTGTQMVHIPYRGAYAGDHGAAAGRNLTADHEHGQHRRARQRWHGANHCRCWRPAVRACVRTCQPLPSPACPASRPVHGGDCTVQPICLIRSSIRSGPKLHVSSARPKRRKLFETNTFELIEMSPEQFVQFIRDDLDNWGRQIKAAGIKPD